MQFGILGTTRVRRDDASDLPVGGPTRRALLALLLLHAGEVVSADRLIEDLYPQQPADRAAHALQSQVSRLRQALKNEAVIELGPAGYRIVVDRDDVDAHRFERLADEGRQALRGGDPKQAASLLRAASALWRGPALADAAEAGSVQAEVTRLEERRLAAREDQIEADLRLGQHRAAVPELHELIARYPLRERLHGLLMRALHADGRPAEALLAFEEIRRRLAEELGADPSTELADIHRALLRGDRPSAAPTLPAQLTSFVGRTEDVAKVAELLGIARLVTLYGTGGAGKTRLSIEVARRHHHDDVGLVELAPVHDPAQVPQAVLNSLGLRDGGLLPVSTQTTPTARLITALADRDLLLILDNCEHLVTAVADLAVRLLAGCPKLRILATSREPLGVTGENLWPVRPLAPAAAVQLLADRAAAVRPGFAIDSADLELSTQICRTLDGLPLAIELAAARLRTLDIGELAVRLQDRFRLLSRGSRTAETRHQTLRAVVAWSWNLLPAAEQAVARRLSVFTGGATAVSAAHVCASSSADGASDVEDLLDALVDKSLLELSDGRYRMLDTIQEYCAEQLAAAGESAVVHRRYTEYFIELARSADPHLRAAGQLDWMRVLAAEHDNLHAALAWAVDAGEVELGLTVLGWMSTYLLMRGLRDSATAQASALLDRIGADPPAGLIDEYVLCALTAAAGAGGREAWERHRATAASIVATSDVPREHPLIGFLWPMLTSAGDPQTALLVMQRAAASPDPWQRAICHLMWGYPAVASGDLGHAERELTAAVDGLRAVGDRWGTALSLDALATLADLHGDAGRAIALTDEALALTEQLGAIEDICDLLCNRAGYRIRAQRAATLAVPERLDLRSAQGLPERLDLRSAQADYERAREIARCGGSRTYIAAALCGLADIARLTGDLAGARRQYEEALALFDAHWIRTVGSRARTLIGLGRVEEAVGALDLARSHYAQAIETALAVGTFADAAQAVAALASLAQLDGEPATAARLLGASTALRGIETDADPDIAAATALATAQLGEAAFRAAYQEALRLTRPDALRLAGVPESTLRSTPLNAVW